MSGLVICNIRQSIVAQCDLLRNLKQETSETRLERARDYRGRRPGRPLVEQDRLKRAWLNCLVVELHLLAIYSLIYRCFSKRVNKTSIL